MGETMLPLNMMKFLYEALASQHRFHQASHIFDVLAWCY